MEDKKNLIDEEVEQVSGGRITPPPKNIEIHKTNEHTGADCIAKRISDEDL